MAFDNVVKRKTWTVEEIIVNVDNNEIGQRQTEGSFSVDDSTGFWSWDRPDERLNMDQQAEWDRVMTALRTVGSQNEDLRHVVDFAGLLDHCLRPELNSDYRSQE